MTKFQIYSQNLYHKSYVKIFIQNCLIVNFSSFCTHINFVVNYQKQFHLAFQFHRAYTIRRTADLYSSNATRTTCTAPGRHGRCSTTSETRRTTCTTPIPTDRIFEDQKTSRPSTNLTSSRRLDTDLTSSKLDTDLISRKQESSTSRRKILINFKFFKISQFFRVVFIIYLSI